VVATLFIGLYWGWFQEDAVTGRQDDVINRDSNDRYGMRWMGNRFSLNVYASRQGRVVDLKGAPLRPGDKAQFEITPRRGETGYAAVVAIENGSVSPLLPRESERAYPINDKTLLPSSVVVERGSHDLEILVFVRAEAFDVSALVAELLDLMSKAEHPRRARGLLFRQTVEM
jgi:hypothetical protein